MGETLAGDVDRFTRVRCYERALAHFPDRTTALSLLNLAMRMAGPYMAIDTADILPDLAAHRIFVKLESLGFIR